jgi:3-oxoacyl-[acyl-carrier-protein] synthase III
MSKITASIKGVHGYVPDYVLTNAELETMVDTNDEWITSRTGIKERRILKGENAGASLMMVKAVQGLLEKTNTDPAEIDMVICCTSTPDLVFPATANIVGTQVGAVNAFGYDIQAACSGFLYGLVTGSQFIESGRFKKVLVIGGDKMSSIIDYKDRATCIIFGDGAGAVLLEANEEGNGLKDFWLRSDGGGEPYLHMTAGGSRRPASHETVDKKEHFVYQDGKTVFKFAVTNMAYAAEQVMKRNELSGEDITYLVPHQANKRIVDATAKSMGVEDGKVLMNIEKYGNTTNGTIPLLLWDFESKFKKGDNLILAAFGGGFTWGAAYLKWAY